MTNERRKEKEEELKVTNGRKGRSLKLTNVRSWEKGRSLKVTNERKGRSLNVINGRSGEKGEEFESDQWENEGEGGGVRVRKEVDRKKR